MASSTVTCTISQTTWPITPTTIPEQSDTGNLNLEYLE
eukprot:gene7088-16798_t